MSSTRRRAAPKGPARRTAQRRGRAARRIYRPPQSRRRRARAAPPTAGPPRTPGRAAPSASAASLPRNPGAARSARSTSVPSLACVAGSFLRLEIRKSSSDDVTTTPRRPGVAVISGTATLSATCVGLTTTAPPPCHGRASSATVGATSPSSDHPHLLRVRQPPQHERLLERDRVQQHVQRAREQGRRAERRVHQPPDRRARQPRGRRARDRQRRPAREVHRQPRVEEQRALDQLVVEPQHAEPPVGHVQVDREPARICELHARSLRRQRRVERALAAAIPPVPPGQRIVLARPARDGGIDPAASRRREQHTVCTVCTAATGASPITVSVNATIGCRSVRSAPVAHTSASTTSGSHVHGSGTSPYSPRIVRATTVGPSDQPCAARPSLERLDQRARALVALRPVAASAAGCLLEVRRVLGSSALGATYSPRTPRMARSRPARRTAPTGRQLVEHDAEAEDVGPRSTSRPGTARATCSWPCPARCRGVRARRVVALAMPKSRTFTAPS